MSSLASAPTDVAGTLTRLTGSLLRLCPRGLGTAKLDDEAGLPVLVSGDAPRDDGDDPCHDYETNECRDYHADRTPAKRSRPGEAVKPDESEDRDSYKGWHFGSASPKILDDDAAVAIREEGPSGGIGRDEEATRDKGEENREPASWYTGESNALAHPFDDAAYDAMLPTGDTPASDGCEELGLVLRLTGNLAHNCLLR